MYSWEIKAILEEYNYNIPSNIYTAISQSEQIIKIKFDAYNDDYELWTSDGGYWRFKVHF